MAEDRDARISCGQCGIPLFGTIHWQERCPKGGFFGCLVYDQIFERLTDISAKTGEPIEKGDGK